MTKTIDKEKQIDQYYIHLLFYNYKLVNYNKRDNTHCSIISFFMEIVNNKYRYEGRIVNRSKYDLNIEKKTLSTYLSIKGDN